MTENQLVMAIGLRKSKIREMRVEIEEFEILLAAKKKAKKQQ